MSITEQEQRRRKWTVAVVGGDTNLSFADWSRATSPGQILHLAHPEKVGRPLCGASLTKWVSPLPTHDERRVNCPDCLNILSREAEGVGGPTPILHTPPVMNENDDGIFRFYDIDYNHPDEQFRNQYDLEVVPQTTGNVELTLGGTLFTLPHTDRADLIRALLHDFHYSPERGGPNDDDN